MQSNLRVRVVALWLALVAGRLLASQEPAWPPPLPGAKDGTVTFQSERFLRVPAKVEALRQEEGAAAFVVASVPPTVDLAFQRDLGPNAIARRLWSSWGDIGLATDGKVYCGIGDHGDDVGGNARCFLYQWDPGRKILTQIADMNQVVPPQTGQPAWSKIHAKIDQGPDGAIYFCCTLNDGGRASQPRYGWTERLPGGQLYRYEPATGRTEVFANLPPKRCTATALLDRQRGIWWCNLEAGEGNALWGLDLASKRTVFQAPDGSMAFNRNFALARDGSIHFNGPDGIWVRDAANRISATGSSLSEAPGMRASTRESSDGAIHGTTYKTNQLFRYRPADGRVEMLGPTWLKGEYTAVIVLSPDERFLYYLPGSHGGGFRTGTPVLQYEIATGRRKVLAFLAEACEHEFGYVPGGTYGIAITPDGGTLYVNFNGHAADPIRPASMKPIGFSLCSFMAIHIPREER